MKKGSGFLLFLKGIFLKNNNNSNNNSNFKTIFE